MQYSVWIEQHRASLGQLLKYQDHLAFMPHWLPYPVPIFGSAIAIALALVLHFSATAYVRQRTHDDRERYRRRKFFTTIIAFAAGLAILILWAHTLRQKGTFLGLLGAGVAIALREPLLSIAGRLAIFAG